MGIVDKGVADLPRSLGCVLLCFFGGDPSCFDANGGLFHGQRAPGLDFLPCGGRACGGFAGLPVRVDRAHSRAGAVRLGRAVLVDQKRDPFAFVHSFLRRGR